ncbi:MAG: IS1182 family transposase [Planctomycetales bacterium]
MGYWAQPERARDQLVLFHQRLDDAIPADHPVRLFDEILGRIDWSAWEAEYHGWRGQPPIHPRVLAAVLLYGLLKKVRSSRALEDALRMRIDFHWLAEGRSIDHTTLSEFRRTRGPRLKDLFVQVVLVAREIGLAKLETLAYDGTRLRADNRLRGAKTPDELRKLRAELARLYEEQERRLAEEDLREQTLFGSIEKSKLPEDLADTARRLARVDAALAELDRVEKAGESVPRRIPMTDPESRILPNKEGAFAPNYTPLATVDVPSGMIAACDVIQTTDEHLSLIPQIERVREDFALPQPPPEVLADGAMPTGANLKALDEMGVTMYAPAKSLDPARNPALRDDPTQPVPEERWDELPTVGVRNKAGAKQQQLKKDAFIYDADRDCYWCPRGKRLSRTSQTSCKRATGRQVRVIYRPPVEDCAACPLKSLCVKQGGTRREVTRPENEEYVEQLARRMATPEAQAKYAQRSHAAERPFATIKQQFAARRFLLRGLEQVRIEWRWLATAFNVHRLMTLIRSRAGPPDQPLSLSAPSPAAC